MDVRKDIKITTAINGEQLMTNLDTKTLPVPYLVFLHLNTSFKKWSGLFL
jgi:hypothetical protein